MARLVVLGVVVAISAASSTVAFPARPVPPPYLSKLPKDECPRVLDLPRVGQIDAIRSAMPGLVRHQLGLAGYGNGTSYRAWQIIAAMSLQPTYATPVPGAAHWRALATAHCGAHVADESWLVTFRFPNMHLIDSVGRFYVALTRSGWRLWAQI